MKAAIKNIVLKSSVEDQVKERKKRERGREKCTDAMRKIQCGKKKVMNNNGKR